MNIITGYLLGSSNYTIINYCNLFNLLIDILNHSTDEQIQQIINSIKINLGITIFNDFKTYLYRKLPKSHIINYI